MTLSESSWLAASPAPGPDGGMGEGVTVPEAGISGGEVGLVTFLSGVLGRLGGRPTWDEYFMATALLLSTRSPCERLHVGCVLVSGGDRSHRIVAAGYNGFLPGVPHRSHLRDGHEQATVHAEQNAVADAARRGISVEGATAYISHFPCVNCAKVLAAAGIRRVLYHFDYRNDSLVPLILGPMGITIEKFQKPRHETFCEKP